MYVMVRWFDIRFRVLIVKHACCSRFVVLTLYRDPNFQEKSFQMLKRIADLETEVSHKIDVFLVSGDQSMALAQSSPSPTQPVRQQIPDAEVVITDPDGKKMFFKKRLRHGMSWSDEDSLAAHTNNPAPMKSALIVPHPPRDLVSISDDVLASTQMRVRQGLGKRLWSASLVHCIARVGCHLAIVRVDENEDDSSLVLSVYVPSISQVRCIAVPLSHLGFILPTSLTWYRISEVRILLCLVYGV